MKNTLMSAVYAAGLALLGVQCIAQIPNPDADRTAMIELGKQFDTAEDLYNYFVDQAGSNTGISYDNMPDWLGVYSWQFPPAGLAYDTFQEPGKLADVKLYPEYQQKYEERVALRDAGIEFDPLGNCQPPGAPRGLSEPFLREYAIQPHQTWLMNEVASETRRIYTDGRTHLNELDRFPTYDGDSIGFWTSDHKLVVHTNQLQWGMYQRGQPDYSDQIELVEVYQKADVKTLVLHVWAYDPEVLMEPWYTRKEYIQLTNTDKQIRMHYWYCFDGQNNAVEEQEDGSTNFIDFDFD